MKYYLPEYTTFAYIALAPWPIDPREHQADWIYSVNMLETWLNQYTGPRLKEWAFAQSQEQQYWQACIAFRQERNRTLFLLRWIQ
jgi:hypothetical protein